MSKACEMKIDGRVIYPGHGLAVVKEFLIKDIGDGQVKFFKLVFPHNKNMEILVPEDRIDECGIRSVSEMPEIEKAFKILKEVPKDLSASALAPLTWKKRQKIYRAMIDSGKLSDVAAIYRDLVYTAERKELSFGEKDMMQKAEGLISQEIHAARKLDGEMEQIIASIRMAVRPTFMLSE
jgi:CarD family transcriptional regulator